jgi:L-ascorbate metabolism protein UlaG (beta-lactamase superfamily)
MSKVITDELINERLEAKGFGEKQEEDLDLARKSVLDYYGVKLTDSYDSNAAFSIYEESTVDGYSVWIATHDTSQINIGEDVHYYDSDLGDALAEAIKYSNGHVDIPETIYVEDVGANYVDEAIGELFVYLSEMFEVEVIDELLNEGYEKQD